MKVSGETSDRHELRERFDRDGYVTIDPELPEAVLDGAVADLRNEYPGTERASLARRMARRLGVKRRIGGYRDPIRIRNAWTGSGNVKAIARAPRVLELLADLYARRPLPFQTINFRIGTQQAPHADAFHFNSQPPGFMCGVWVALEDIDMDNGPLVYYPGSHRLPEVTPRQLGAPIGSEGYPAYEDYIRRLIDKQGLEPRYATLRKGAALIWASNLLHGGATQRDRSRTRLSQVTHYFFEGCRYWTPMASDERHVEWRDPNWVS